MAAMVPKQTGMHGKGWGIPPPTPKKGSIDGAPQNPTETDPRASEVTRTQKSAKTENGIFVGISASRGRAVLNRKKKLFRYMVFSKTTACSSYVQPWLVAIGGWRLVEIAGWRLTAVGGSWQLVMGGWWRLAAVDGWRLVAVGGWWRLAVNGWWSLGVVLKGGP